MIEQLFNSMKAALAQRWKDRMPSLVARSAEVAQATLAALQTPTTTERDLSKAIQEAYLAGVRDAYWDGMLDFVEVGMAAEEAAEMASAHALSKMTATALEQAC